MIRFSCNNCSKKLKVPMKYAEHKVKCPDCNSVLVVPQPPQQPKEENELRNMLSSLDEGETIEHERPAPKSEPATSGLEAFEPPKPAGPSSAAAASASKFTASVICSCVGALIGAFIWALIAKFTGYEIGYIAIGVGVLSGFGILFGGAEPSQKLGVTAAVIALCAIIGGKVLVLNWIYDEYAEKPVSAMTDREILASLDDQENLLGVAIFTLMDDNLRDKFSNGTELNDDERQQITDITIKAGAIAGAWTDEEKIHNARLTYSFTREQGIDADKASIIKEGLIQSLGIMDLLFAALAVGAAYKLGSGSNA